MKGVVEGIADFLIPEQRIVTQHFRVSYAGLKIETSVCIDRKPCLRSNLLQHGFDAPTVFVDRRTADLHLHDVVATIEITAHFSLQRGIIFPRVIVTASRINENTRIGLAALLLCQKAEQRLTCNFCDRVPDCHVERADGYRTLAVAARLFVRHHRRPDTMRVEIGALVVEKALGFGLDYTIAKAFPDQTALTIATI